MTNNTETFDSLWCYCVAQDRIIPADWHRGFYKMLSGTHRDPSGGWIPPLPLILGAWFWTSVLEKQLRFKEQVKWASDHGQLEKMSVYLRSLSEDQWLHIGEVPDGSEYDFCFGEQFMQPKWKPDKKQIADTLDQIKRDWQDIVGADLARATRPKKFTGRKARRLVVHTNGETLPQWCTWRSMRGPTEFTKFRKSINLAISPMEVDHIVFNEKKWLSKS